MILWDFEARRPIANLRAHKEIIFGLAFTSDGKTLATTGFDKEIKFWRGFKARRSAAPLTAEAFGVLWEELAARDAARMNDAVEILGGAPEQSIPFLMERLRTVKSTENDKVAAAFIGQLKDERFKVRETATQELAKIGPAIAPHLRLALEKGEPLEARRRVLRLLADLTIPESTPEQKRLQYAILALELTAAPDARKTLTELAEGGAGGLLAEEAFASLQRIGGANKNRQK